MNVTWDRGGVHPASDAVEPAEAASGRGWTGAYRAGSSDPTDGGIMPPMSELRCDVLLFGPLRDRAGVRSLSVVLDTPACAADAWDAVVTQFPLLGPERASMGVAVNQSYCPWSTALAQDDAVAFLPPVAGG